MTWRIRLAVAEDYEAVADLAYQNTRESCPQREWSDARMRHTFFEDYLKDSNGIFFVAEKDGAVHGFLLTGVYEYRAFVGLFTVQEVLFVRPDKRGSRAAALLMKKLIEWSVSLGAKEIVGGNDNDVHSERTARFLSRFGFRSYGYSMKLELEHGR